MSLRCMFGDNFPDNGAGEPIFEPCGEAAVKVVYVGDDKTPACLRHAVAARKFADKIVGIKRTSRRDTIPPAERCKLCDGTGHGIGGAYCVQCMGSGFAP